MAIEYDALKNQKNINERELPFSLVECFDFETADIKQDLRQMNEKRLIAVGRIKFHIYTLVFTERGINTRVISLRKASRKEKQLWKKNLIHI
jgi:uncharacterized protein